MWIELIVLSGCQLVCCHYFWGRLRQIFEKQLRLLQLNRSSFDSERVFSFVWKYSLPAADGLLCGEPRRTRKDCGDLLCLLCLRNSVRLCYSASIPLRWILFYGLYRCYYRLYHHELESSGTEQGDALLLLGYDAHTRLFLASQRSF